MYAVVLWKDVPVPRDWLAADASRDAMLSAPGIEECDIRRLKKYEHTPFFLFFFCIFVKERKETVGFSLIRVQVKVSKIRSVVVCEAWYVLSERERERCPTYTYWLHQLSTTEACSRRAWTIRLIYEHPIIKNENLYKYIDANNKEYIYCFSCFCRNNYYRSLLNFEYLKFSKHIPVCKVYVGASTLLFCFFFSFLSFNAMLQWPMSGS